MSSGSWREEVGSDLSKPVGIRAFARWIGVSDTAVRKAMAAEKIHGNAILDGGTNRPKIIPAIAVEQWGKVYDPQFGHSKNLADKFIDNAPTSKGSTGEDESPASTTTLAKAKQAKAVYDAKLAELEYKEKAKILVKKDDVYRALFGYGQELRAKMQSIPDRVIDEILSAKSRNAAHQILYNAISNELEFLATLNQKSL